MIRGVSLLVVYTGLGVGFRLWGTWRGSNYNPRCTTMRSSYNNHICIIDVANNILKKDKPTTIEATHLKLMHFVLISWIFVRSVKVQQHVLVPVPVLPSNST
jgi:hypothetical protein